MPIKRIKLTKEMLLTQVEAVNQTKNCMEAASRCNTGYPTFLARFRKVGLKARDVKSRLVANEMPEQIAFTAFKKMKKLEFKKANNLETIAAMLKDVSLQLGKIRA